MDLSGFVYLIFLPTFFTIFLGYPVCQSQYITHGTIDVNSDPWGIPLWSSASFIPDSLVHLPTEHWIVGWKMKVDGCTEKLSIQVKI